MKKSVNLLAAVSNKSASESVLASTNFDEDIVITDENFTYLVKYHDADGSLYIQATHNSDYLIWSNVVDNVSQSYEKSRLDINLAPKVVYVMLKDYSKGKLKKNISIKFPDGYKAADSAITIMITCTLLTYDDKYRDTKMIILNPVEVSYEQRVHRKLQSLTSHIDSRFENINDSISDIRNTFVTVEEFEEQCIKMDDSVIELKQSIADTDECLEDMKKEFNAKIDNTVAALKAELMAEITKAINASKTEVIALIEKAKVDMQNASAVTAINTTNTAISTAVGNLKAELAGIYQPKTA